MFDPALSEQSRALDAVERTSHLIETEALNPCGYVPVISEFSGLARVVGGKIQIITGIALAIFYSISSKANTDHVQRSFKLVRHGVENIFRGFVEMLWIWGNVICYLYDNPQKRHAYSLEASKAV